MAFTGPSGCITLHILSPPHVLGVLAFHVANPLAALRRDGSSYFTKWLPEISNGLKSWKKTTPVHNTLHLNVLCRPTIESNNSLICDITMHLTVQHELYRHFSTL